MKKKILLTLTTLILVILPFLVGIPLSKYSPYVEPNSIQTYIIIWTLITVAFVAIITAFFKYYSQSFGNLFVGGLLLFLLVSPIIGIIGLAAAPDLSLKMLEHPEREHLRYIFLFIAALLFGAFSIALLQGNSFQMKNSTKWIMTMFFFLAFAEFIWEFYHHYLYPEGLKEWISQGKNAEEFGKNYDNTTILNIGVIGRYFQFISVIWLSIHLYKLRQIKIWSPIIITIFGLLGIVSATLVFVTGFPFPKGFEFLMLFFIPGIPFLLLYWLGVALLTKFKKSEIATE